MTNPYEPSEGSSTVLDAGAADADPVASAPRFRWRVLPALGTYLFAALFGIVTLVAVLGIVQTGTSTAFHPFRVAEMCEAAFAGSWLAVACVTQVAAARGWMRQRYALAALLNGVGVLIWWAIIRFNGAAYIPWRSATTYWGWDPG